MLNENDWNNFLLKLKEKNDIVDVISSYIEVKARGRGYWALCPFHNDKNPSLSINRTEQYYHCFVCKKGGDVFHFIMDYESCSFMDAVEILAKRAGMEIPNQKGANDDYFSEKKKDRDLHYEICRETALFYHATLMSEKGEKARAYLKNRGLGQSIINKFGMGYSPDFDALRMHLNRMGFDKSDIVKAGVLNESKNKRLYDPLSERVIVPIFNIYGNVIAFGGRILNTDKELAKYKNTVVTDIFDKSKNLFAINFAKKRKQEGKLEYIIIVEGYMDVLALHQAGFEMTVASMGTALTNEQARLISRLVNDVYICYDGDSAGQAATLRGLDILKNEGLNVRVVSMPDGIDPDDCVRQKGTGAFESYLKSALPLTDYKLKCAWQLSGAEKVVSISEKREAYRTYAEKALEILKPLNGIEQDSYLRLVRDQTGIAYDMLKRDLVESDTRFENTADNAPVSEIQSDLFSFVTAEDRAAYFVLASFLHGKRFAGAFGGFETENEFFATVASYLADCVKAGRPPSAGELYAIPGIDRFSEELVRLLSVEFFDDESDEKYFADCLSVLQKTRLKTKIEALNKAYNEETDTQKRNAIATELAALVRLKNKN